MKISIVIPVYNEFRTFPAVLERVRRAELPAGCSREIIVIDDGSTDGIGEVLREHAGTGAIIAHRSEKNFGKGSALRAGLARANSRE